MRTTTRTGRHRLRLMTAAVAMALAATACAGTDPAGDLTDDAAPSSTAAAPTSTTAAEVEKAAPAEPAWAPPPITAATTTTTEAPREPAPQIVIWSTPRLFDTTLSASWQVTPEDSNCGFNLFDDQGNVIGTGVATTVDADPSGRGMRANYDPASADALGTVTIVCNRLGGHRATSEHPVHRVAYQNRHPDSVIPADDDHYFDHDEIRALFPECGPGGRLTAGGPVWDEIVDQVSDLNGNGYPDIGDFLSTGLVFWDEVFENWDTETHETPVSGKVVASGWWTTRQLRMMHPKNNTITADIARRDVLYLPGSDSITFFRAGRNYSPDDTELPDWAIRPQRTPLSSGGGDGYGYLLRDLYMLLDVAVGAVSDDDDYWNFNSVIEQWVTDTGIARNEPNPATVKSKNLLWDWMDTRYGYEPIDREPTAWAMRTLLETRDAGCVASEMRAHCDSANFHPSRHMRDLSQGGSRLGSALWSIVCPEITP